MEQEQLSRAERRELRRQQQSDDMATAPGHTIETRT